MKQVTVVGAGIIGLTTAICLQEVGFLVKIIAKEVPKDTLSNKVGAVWFPFEVHPKEKAIQWASIAYQRYLKEKDQCTGVSFISFMTAYTSNSNTDWAQQIPKNAVRKATKNELTKSMKNAFIAEVPLAEPPLYLPQLYQRFINNGGSFKKAEVLNLDELSNLAPWVVNCTGLGAKLLCNDPELRPMRGQILRCKKIDSPSCADSTKKGGLSYIINRSNDSIVGGTDYENDNNSAVDPADTVLILKRLKEYGLYEQKPEILETVVGLRPWRARVRFEFDKKHPSVFHNYGHGGAGFTVGWGCAMELAAVLKEASKT